MFKYLSELSEPSFPPKTSTINKSYVYTYSVVLYQQIIGENGKLSQSFKYLNQNSFLSNSQRVVLEGMQDHTDFYRIFFFHRVSIFTNNAKAIVVKTRGISMNKGNDNKFY